MSRTLLRVVSVVASWRCRVPWARVARRKDAVLQNEVSREPSEEVRSCRLGSDQVELGINVVVVARVCLLSFAGTARPPEGRSGASGSRAPPRVEEAPRNFPSAPSQDGSPVLWRKTGGGCLRSGGARRMWTVQLGVLMPQQGRGLGVEFLWGSWDAVPMELWGRGGVRGGACPVADEDSHHYLGGIPRGGTGISVRGRGEWTWYRHAIEVVGLEHACQAAVGVREER